MIHIRSRSEIEKIRVSSRIVAETLELLFEMIKPGITPRELDAAAEKYIVKQNAIPGFKGLYGFPATVCISIEEEVVHGIPHDRPLTEGQIVGLDVGALKDGYYGDHARSFAVGNVDTNRQRLMDVTLESLVEGIDAARVGNRISDIGYAVQTVAEGAGFGVVRELVGHGIGTKLHEEPQIPNYGKPGQGFVIKEGMCFAIEPMINMGTEKILTKPDGWTVVTVDGKPSAHFEHTIAVTANGPEILTVC